jgi:hypothetical protein
LNAQNRPEGPSGAESAGAVERALVGFGRVREGTWKVVRTHALTVVTVAALLGASLLVLAKFLEVVRFIQLGGDLIPGAEASRKGSAALLVIGLAAGLAALAARWTEQSLPALASAALGAIALGMALIGDLPDVTSSGITSGTLIGSADPGPGFWVELAGATVTLVAGLALARLLALENRKSGHP